MRWPSQEKLRSLKLVMEVFLLALLLPLVLYHLVKGDLKSALGGGLNAT